MCDHITVIKDDDSIDLYNLADVKKFGWEVIGTEDVDEDYDPDEDDEFCFCAVDVDAILNRAGVKYMYDIGFGYVVTL